MGGVGSVCSYLVGEDDDSNLESLRGWNWSDRLAGHVIVNPLHVESGYVCKEDLPVPRPGYGWMGTYAGSTLSEFVLVALDGRHDLPVVHADYLSPEARKDLAFEQICVELGFDISKEEEWAGVKTPIWWLGEPNQDTEEGDFFSVEDAISALAEIQVFGESEKVNWGEEDLQYVRETLAATAKSLALG
jgi:hypothetical protein